MCSINDLLTSGCLAASAHATLWRELNSTDRSGLAAARLVSRSFRAFVDGEVTELRLRLELVLAGPPAALYDPSKHWLNRWPRCTKVTLHAEA
ncbi:hypothetical protein HYH03_005481 [Edaphochlamys debaryana]|uniref:F-box domain-containing protein n=1 Tax=Edaphochlamys debaryana TaxID=47281 RepID=A0A836C186_9CHLO|nr:hypothetical protein HYH03_005481 [Edaphochlamys debaryana]|eukprot:KAG2496661.1 hypothetical protein HYH03_005481 [Edaphochlamys debaryana]